MIVTFQKATKTQSRLRMALDGPSGSGKTYTGLVFATALAKGIGNGRVAVIDTERGSAAKYADRFDFDVLALDTFAPKLYCEAIDAAEQAGYPVILIDSLSHAWEGEGGVLDLHDQATRRQASQNSFTAWKDVTPIHRRLVDAILTSSAHVIVTMRSKMDYTQVTENGRSVVKKVGMGPVQRQGIEYEFDIVGDLDTEHNMAITKSRCFAAADAVVNKPTAEWFKVVKDWLTEGVPMAAPEKKPAAQVADSGVGAALTPPTRGDLLNRLTALAHEWYPENPGVQLNAHLKRDCGGLRLTDLTDAELREQIAIYEKRIAERRPQAERGRRPPR